MKQDGCLCRDTVCSHIESSACWYTFDWGFYVHRLHQAINVCSVGNWGGKRSWLYSQSYSIQPNRSWCQVGLSGAFGWSRKGETPFYEPFLLKHIFCSHDWQGWCMLPHGAKQACLRKSENIDSIIIHLSVGCWTGLLQAFIWAMWTLKIMLLLDHRTSSDEIGLCTSLLR